MALGLKLPLVGIPSLDVIAYAQPLDERPLIAVLHAGRSRLAYVTYLVEGDQWCPQHEPAVLDAKDLVKTISAPTLIAGELSGEARTILGRRWKNAMIVQAGSLPAPGGVPGRDGMGQIDE